MKLSKFREKKMYDTMFGASVMRDTVHMYSTRTKSRFRCNTVVYKKAGKKKLKIELHINFFFCLGAAHSNLYEKYR